MRDVEHSIQLVPDYRVHHQAPYRLSIPEATELKRQLEELLRLGFIKPSNSPWGAPILFARKADETLRLCIDYRGLNRYTVKNSYPMSRSDELFDRLAGNRFFTKIDLRSGYHQIRVAAADQPKTAFQSRFGHYEFTVMPFGLTNAPATFQRAMNDIFRNILEQYVLVYLDDILVYSRTLEEHLRHLRDVLDRLRRHGLYAKLSKCRFAQHKVHFLGHYVSDQGLHMDDAKITAIAEWPAPTSAKQLRTFLGLTSYYSNFIRGYARYSYVLTSTLLRKNPPWAWTPLHEDAFRALKKAVTCAPVLHLPDFDRPFILTTDASNFAVGAVLSQVFPSSPDSSHPRIPRFPPPTPTTAFRLTPTRPATDEPSIDYSPTIAEDGTVESRSGDCPIAFYSRQLLPAEINYTADERELRVRAVAEFHDQAAAGHMGFHKTLARVSRPYVYLKRKDFVKDYVAECPTCQEVNSVNHLPYGLLQPLPIPEGRWQSISMDFIGPLRPPTPRGHDAILVIVDRFTKRARFVPCRYAISALEVADIVFDRVVRDHDLPLSIISDRDPRFTSRFWRRLHEVYDTQLRFSSSYHPQTDGQTEITNRTLGDIL
uniref:Reverse transcriptase domain-containing protein n=1 Tax=Chara braunii TaxID=69332 RepID=A0A388JNY7_CHABU